MDGGPGDEQRRNSTLTTVALAGVIAIAAAVGVVVTVLQRPPHPLPAPVNATPAALPTAPVSPTPLPTGPVSAFGFNVVDDPAVHGVLFFGGVGSYDATWLWNGSHWLHANPSVSPPGRFNAAAAYDPATTAVVLFGGRLEDGEVRNDTWAWDGSSWRELNDGAGGPPPGEGALMAWDKATDTMVLVTPTESTNATGGETWTWSGSRWVRVPGGDLPAPLAGEMAFDPVSRTLLFVSPLLPPGGEGVATWQWMGSSWRELAATPPLATTGLALDPTSGHLLLCSDPTTASQAMLWSWTGATWQPVPNSALSVELGSAAVDLDRDEFLMFGFLAPTTQPAPQPVHVWGWSGRAWLRLDP
jgi:hypothetical protein